MSMGKHLECLCLFKKEVRTKFFSLKKDPNDKLRFLMENLDSSFGFFYVSHLFVFGLNEFSYVSISFGV